MDEGVPKIVWIAAGVGIAAIVVTIVMLLVNREASEAVDDDPIPYELITTKEVCFSAGGQQTDSDGTNPVALTASDTGAFASGKVCAAK